MAALAGLAGLAEIVRGAHDWWRWRPQQFTIFVTAIPPYAFLRPTIIGPACPRTPSAPWQRCPGQMHGEGKEDGGNDQEEWERCYTTAIHGVSFYAPSRESEGDDAGGRGAGLENSGPDHSITCRRWALPQPPVLSRKAN